MTTAIVSAHAPLNSGPAKARTSSLSVEVTDRVTSIGLSITLILFLLYGPDAWYVRAFLAAASIIGLIWRGTLANPWLWLALSSLLGSAVYVERFSADNHQYLMAYWALAIALSYFTPSPFRYLRTNARLLVGLAFAFAAGWKLFSPDFLSGSFFEFTLLSDQRFSGFAAWISGTSPDVLAANRDAIRGLYDDSRGAPLVLQGEASLRSLAVTMAWFTVAIETWIAAAFLLPSSWWPSRTRDVALNAFLLTTYAVATVPGFAYVLIAMGLVQCERKPQWVRFLYFVSLVATQVYTIPWARIALRFSGGG
jgi:hypothetical protein